MLSFKKMKRLLKLLFFLLPFSALQAQDSTDVEAVQRMVQLSEVVVRSDLNVARFLQRIKDDTTYYKAFKNLHILGYTSLNSIQLRNKKGKIEASLESKTRQQRANGCRTMEVLQEKTTGDFYDRRGNMNYYTAELYASLFFTQDTVCGENNVVAGTNFSPKGKKGLAKHKEQLKLLFFNPGKRIPGIPLMSDRKIDPFDPATAELYDFEIDYVDISGQPAYKFSIHARSDLRAGERDKLVIDEIVTWFDAKSMDVLARNYRMSYSAGVYDFDVIMEVELAHVEGLLVPVTLRYKGNWDVAFKPRERGVFTATLSDFGR